MALTDQQKQDLYHYCLRLGDDRLILGHRLSEWCGHGPILEEDIAISNIALDLIGQAVGFLTHAGELEGEGRDEDALAYFREAIDFENAMLVEQPNGHYGDTIARQFLFDAFSFHLMESLSASPYEPLAALGAKTLKEVRYHLRHSSQWMLRFGDGTEESHARVQQSLDDLWRYTGELFLVDALEQRLVDAGLIPDAATLKAKWDATVGEVLTEATLKRPEDGIAMEGGRQGRHTEYLGHILAEMQILPRSYPGAAW